MKESIVNALVSFYKISIELATKFFEEAFKIIQKAAVEVGHAFVLIVAHGLATRYKIGLI